MAWKVVLFVCFVASCTAFEDKTVVEYLRDNGYNKFLDALNTAGLTGTLDGTGMY